MKKITAFLFFQSIFLFLFFLFPKNSLAAYCGNTVCETGEDCYNCNKDCKICPTPVPSPTPRPTAIPTPVPTLIINTCPIDGSLCGITPGCNCYQRPQICCSDTPFCSYKICPPESAFPGEIAWLVCEPNCSDPDRDCHESPSCDPPINCNEVGGDAFCAGLDGMGCGPGSTCYGVARCAVGGNCWIDCSACSFHWTCDGPNCILASGVGTNTCSSTAECRTPPDSHNACVNKTCVKVAGSGTNQCNSTSDCFETIGGRVVNSDTGGGIPNLWLSVYNDATKNTRSLQTNSTGYWSLSSFISENEFFAVRIAGNTAPFGYNEPRRTTTAVYTCGDETLAVGRGSYECQWSEHTNYDCGMACNWEYDPTPIYPECRLFGSLAATVGVPETYTITGNEVIPNWVFVYYSPTSDSTTRVRVAEIPPASFGSTPYPFSVTFPAIGDYFLDCDVYRASPYALCTGHPWCIGWVPDVITQTLDCVALNYSDCGSYDVLPISVRGVGPWFQTVGGDIQAQADISSQIPASALSGYLSVSGDGGTPGVVGFGSTLNTGEGDISEKLWTANTSYLGTSFGFGYFLKQMRVDTSNAYSGSLSTSDSQASGSYYSNSDLVISEAFPAGKKIVIFVNGNVTITDNLVVPPGSFLAIISSGNISFSSGVTQAQGFFLADGTITVDGPDGGQFGGEGSFVAKNGVVFSRDLGDPNQTTPAEVFTQRPDFYINAPSSFKISSSYFKEVEP